MSFTSDNVCDPDHPDFDPRVGYDPERSCVFCNREMLFEDGGRGAVEPRDARPRRSFHFCNVCGEIFAAQSAAGQWVLGGLVEYKLYGEESARDYFDCRN